jgi:hypothetical protein
LINSCAPKLIPDVRCFVAERPTEPEEGEIWTFQQKKKQLQKNINYCKYNRDCDPRYISFCEELDQQIKELNDNTCNGVCDIDKRNSLGNN